MMSQASSGVICISEALVLSSGYQARCYIVHAENLLFAGHYADGVSEKTPSAFTRSECEESRVEMADKKALSPIMRLILDWGNCMHMQRSMWVRYSCLITGSSVTKGQGFPMRPKAVAKQLKRRDIEVSACRKRKEKIERIIIAGKLCDWP